MTNIIVRVSGGIVQEVITELPGMNVTVIDNDIEAVGEEDIIEIDQYEYYLYTADVQNYNPEKAEKFIKQIKAEVNAEYYVFGGSFSKAYYSDDFDNLFKEIEANYNSWTFSLHKYTPLTPISQVIADAEGWDGTAQVTRKEWYRLTELQETMNHGKN